MGKFGVRRLDEKFDPEAIGRAIRRALTDPQTPSFFDLVQESGWQSVQSRRLPAEKKT